MGIPRLMKVASMYKTMEIRTFPAPTLNWASWNEMEPLVWPPRILSPSHYMNSYMNYMYYLDMNVHKKCFFSVTIGILILFETKMLTTCQLLLSGKSWGGGTSATIGALMLGASVVFMYVIHILIRNQSNEFMESNHEFMTPWIHIFWIHKYLNSFVYF